MVWMVEIGCGEMPCEHPHGVMAAFGLFSTTNQPYPFHLRLHESNLRHVGGPCEVIGLAMAKTRRFASSLMDARGM